RFVEQVPGQKKRVLSTHIKKGRGHAYSMSHFKKEPAWAQELIQQVETRYAVLRQRATALAKNSPGAKRVRAPAKQDT
ncbi:conjugative transfer protein MobI(A/C), partial [Shigella sp. FC1967]|uniref:conjugative transfer protein MobI(A/C) n=1 Tax=Shigella sp. FC1967 TaxID=1898041 RepID=UPI000AF26EC8